MMDWRTEVRRGDRVIRFAQIVSIIAVGVLAWMGFVLFIEDLPAHGQESVTAHDSCDPAYGFVTVPYVTAASTGGAYLNTRADGWCRSRMGWRITHVRALLTTQAGQPGSWVTYSTAAKSLGRLCNNARTACHTAGSDSEYCPIGPSTPGFYYRTHLRVHTYGHSVANDDVTFHHVRDLNSEPTTRRFACGQRQP